MQQKIFTFPLQSSQVCASFIVGSGGMLPRKIVEFCTSPIAGYAQIYYKNHSSVSSNSEGRNFTIVSTSDGQNSRVPSTRVLMREKYSGEREITSKCATEPKQMREEDQEIYNGEGGAERKIPRIRSETNQYCGWYPGDLTEDWWMNWVRSLAKWLPNGLYRQCRKKSRCMQQDWWDLFASVGSDHYI